MEPFSAVSELAVSTAARPPARILRRLEQVNKEVWLLLTMFVIIALMNYLVASQRVLLGLYSLPTIVSAYWYGRRHATLTALASVLLVTGMVYRRPVITDSGLSVCGWYDLVAWGGILIIAAYTMGTLYERNRTRIAELRATYQGLIVILRHFISKDSYTENHCYRVAVYAVTIARYLGCSAVQTEDIRAAALLHDVGKLDISRELLYKASQLTDEEYAHMQRHVDRGVQMVAPVERPLGRVIPIILAHHERYDGSGYHQAAATQIPVEARIIAVADVYDALTSDRPYRKAMSPYEARTIIEQGSGTDFDPVVVQAFLRGFHDGAMEVPKIVL